MNREIKRHTLDRIAAHECLRLRSRRQAPVDRARSSDPKEFSKRAPEQARGDERRVEAVRGYDKAKTLCGIDPNHSRSVGASRIVSEPAGAKIGPAEIDPLVRRAPSRAGANARFDSRQIIGTEQTLGAELHLLRQESH